MCSVLRRFFEYLKESMTAASTLSEVLKRFYSHTLVSFLPQDHIFLTALDLIFFLRPLLTLRTLCRLEKLSWVLYISTKFCLKTRIPFLAHLLCQIHQFIKYYFLFSMLPWVCFAKLSATR